MIIESPTLISAPAAGRSTVRAGRRGSRCPPPLLPECGRRDRGATPTRGASPMRGRDRSEDPAIAPRTLRWVKTLTGLELTAALAARQLLLARLLTP